jgi:hypothetical protein
VLKVFSAVAVLLICQSAIAASVTTSESAKLLLRNAVGSILQADGQKAREHLLAIPVAELSAKDANFRLCALTRLSKPPSEQIIVSPITRKNDRFTQRLVSIYRQYWYDSAAKPEQREQTEKILLSKLNQLLGSAISNIDDLAPLMEERLKKRGLRLMKGRTGYLQELMIWRREETQVVTVELPEESNPTTVFFKHDFLSLGWSNYLSCGRTGTGGWTDSVGLHVVTPSYDNLTDENFKVNFLAHESQHFADKRRYKTIENWELEYRAKLAEMAFAAATMEKLLLAFSANQSDDQSDPHSYANKRVLTAVRNRLNLTPEENLKAVAIPAINQAAIAELKADSKKRAEP